MEKLAGNNLNIEGEKMRRQKFLSISDQVTGLIVVILLSPVILLTLRTWGLETENWVHLLDYLLAEAVITTIWLAFLSILGAGLIGVLGAWLVSCYDFPFRSTFEWLLMLPIAIPPYIAAYVYAGTLSYTGSLQTTTRSFGLIIPQNWIDIMSLPGASFIFVITLYPYIYIIVKSFLKQHSSQFIENARIMGYNGFGILIKVILPLIRIPLMGAMILVLMETISDYGVVKYYGLQTISTLIFKAWFGMRDLGLAGRLSLGLLMGILIILGTEEWIRGRRGYSIGSGKSGDIGLTKLNLTGTILAVGFLSTMFMIAFMIPVGQMLFWTFSSWGKVDVVGILRVFIFTILMSVLAAIIILLASILIGHRTRFLGSRISCVINRMTQVGYSVPGAIIAVGTLILFVSLDGLLYPVYQLFHPETKKLILSSGLIMLLFAYVVRYMAIGYTSVQSGFTKIGNRFREASSVIGYSTGRTLMTVELPMLQRSLMAGFILVFIDVLKELPLTLLLRPFNYDSLATMVYVYAGDERIHEASIPSLAIVGISLFAVMFLEILNHQKKRSM